MSCFLDSSSPSEANPQTIYANDDDTDVTYQPEGNWKSQGSQPNSFKVSGKLRDQAIFVFTGTSVQVSGQIDSKGMNARFGVDTDGRQGGGTTCQKGKSSLSSQDTLLLYDSSALTRGQHTLFITNQGDALSLNAFKVFGGSTPTISNPDPTGIATSMPTLSSTSTSTPPSITPASTHVTTSPTSNSASTGIGTDITSISLTLPLPHGPSGMPPGTSSHDITQAAAGSAEPAKSDPGGTPSYTVYSYTKVSTMSGSTVTLVIQTTVEVQQSQPYHGPSRGAVAGAAVGGLLFLFLLIGLGLWWWRRRRNRVRFLYGISNLDFDPAMMTRSSAELPNQGRPGVRDSDATMYGDILPPYKRPVSYSSLAWDLKKDPPVEYAPSVVAGDHRLAAYAEPKTRSPSEERLSMCNSHSVRGQESVESVVRPSEEC